jgi:Ca2+-binding RTX toxin-like protein
VSAPDAQGKKPKDTEMPLGLRTALALTALLLLLSSQAVLAAGNTVPVSKASKYSVAITADTLKPASCAGITLTTLVIGVTGTSGNDLLLGTANPDTMNGAAGNDCILGGGGNDTITGGNGTDVCIGGPGTDTFSTCETQIQ